jgi:hypothetical protein
LLYAGTSSTTIVRSNSGLGGIYRPFLKGWFLKGLREGRISAGVGIAVFRGRSVGLVAPTLSENRLAPDNARMCARFTLRRRLNLVIKELAEMMPVGLFDFDPELRYNIAATQQIAAVRATADAGQRKAAPLKWGLIRIIDRPTFCGLLNW